MKEIKRFNFESFYNEVMGRKSIVIVTIVPDDFGGYKEVHNYCTIEEAKVISETLKNAILYHENSIKN